MIALRKLFLNRLGFLSLLFLFCFFGDACNLDAFMPGSVRVCLNEATLLELVGTYPADAPTDDGEEERTDFENSTKPTIKITDIDSTFWIDFPSIPIQLLDLYFDENETPAGNPVLYASLYIINCSLLN